MKRLLLSLLLLPSLIWALVFDSDQISSLLPYVEEGTWVIFDVDQTLIESSVNLGSSQWRKAIHARAKETGMEDEEAQRVTKQFADFMHRFTPPRLVDPETPELIQQLQQSGVFVMGLTARRPENAERTREQLAACGISLRNRISENFVLLATHPAIYQDGAIHAGPNSKSSVLLQFIKKTGELPRKVIFVDDRPNQIADLEQLLARWNIDYVGIHYTAAAKQAAAPYDPAIADLQWRSLPAILSDERASTLSR